MSPEMLHSTAESDPAAQRDSVPAVQCNGLLKTFGNQIVLDRVQLTIPKGCVFALLGQNGAGKTTLMKTLTGFIAPTAGDAQILGMDCASRSREIRQRIGYVSDQPALYTWMTAPRIGWFASAFYPEGFLSQYHELLAYFKVPTNRAIKKMSKGQRAKVALALAVAHQPDLLIMDEPTSGLDPLVRRQFLESMVDRAAQGRTVLLSSHQIAEVERVADWVAIMHKGRIRVVSPLQKLREETNELIVSLSDPMVRLPDLQLPDDEDAYQVEPSNDEVDGIRRIVPTTVFREFQEGRQARIMIRGDAQSVRDRVLQLDGVSDVQVRSPTLEEIFLAYSPEDEH